VGRCGRVHTAYVSIWTWGVPAGLWDLARHVYEVPTRVFGGGGHLFGCCYRWWQYCCVAAVEMGTTMTMSLLSSTARAIFLLACVVSGRRRWWVPTWLLPVCCLYLSFPSSIFLLLPFFPTPHLFIPFSLLQAHIERV